MHFVRDLTVNFLGIEFRSWRYCCPPRVLFVFLVTTFSFQLNSWERFYPCFRAYRLFLLHGQSWSGELLVGRYMHHVKTILLLLPGTTRSPHDGNRGTAATCTGIYPAIPILPRYHVVSLLLETLTIS